MVAVGFGGPWSAKLTNRRCVMFFFSTEVKSVNRERLIPLVVIGIHATVSYR